MDTEKEESNQERQEQEFIVLQSMYSTYLKDLRTKLEKKTRCPPKFCITLFPLHSAGHTRESSAQLDLHIIYEQDYPDKVPGIFIENTKGLLKNSVETLLEELKALAKNRCGEVMIHDLTHHVEDYLHRHNEPHYESIYDEMICNQKRRQEAEAMEEQKQKEKQRLQEEEEREVKKLALREKKEALKEERKKELLNSETTNDNSTNAISLDRHSRECSPGFESPILSRPSFNFGIKGRQRGSSKSESSSSQDSCSVCDHSCVTIYQYQINRNEKRIQRGKCLGHKKFVQNVVYFGVDMESGEPVAVSEWTLNWCHSGRKSDVNNSETANLIKQLGNLEQELSSLNKLQHKNLVHYLGMKYIQERSKIVVLIFQEFVAGSSIGYYLSEKIPVEYQLLSHHMQGILSALSYLHRNSVVHKNLRDTSVFVESKGLIRVADYSLDKRLVEIYCSVTKEDIEESFPPSAGRGGKKADIYRLGILCLSLAKGEMVNTMYPEIPNFLPPVLRDFLERCLTRQEQERWTADELLEHAFLKPVITREPSPGKEFVCEPDDKLVEKSSELQPEVLQPLLSGDRSSNSRLHNEFDIIDCLGKGGFGIVYKVENILDSGFYAIKCIQLNPNNKKLNNKIMREVKLLSKLNHENVVRYYNSWLEMKTVDDLSISESSIQENESATTTYMSEMPENGLPVSVPSKSDSVGDWLNFSINNQTNDLDDTSSEEEEEEEDIYRTSVLPALEETSESIIFGDRIDEQPLSIQSNYCTEDNSSNKTTVENRDTAKIIQIMYIQMEFCDKSTLRTVIDSDLYKDEKRVMRLFREIVEGLAHIHQQGMIHRDLKPGNIFLDSQDHVKIGDFGLATTNNLSQIDTHLLQQHSSLRNLDHDTSHCEGATDGSLTGWVGTILYIAPEVADKALRTSYNQKVDIYSLGIILFEMCFNPLNTEMERAIVLGDIRKSEIAFPENFEKETLRQAKIIRWLLDHDPGKRPTAQELLQSSYLPLQMEEAKLWDMLKHTISNPQSKTFKRMISSLFKQDISTVADVTYDFNMHKDSFNSTTTLTYKFVIDTLVKVLKKHGAIPITCPLLMPKSSLYNRAELCVNLVDHSGSVVTLPYDLRVPFCRYAAKNNITSLKRYQIAPVYRERKVYGCHPRTQYECAFDIVTPSPGSLVSDAEVLTIVLEIISEFPHLRNRRYLIRLNHTSLLKGILLYCGISEDRHDAIYAVFNKAKANNLSKYQIEMELAAQNISEEMAETVFRLVELEGPIETIQKNVKSILKRKGHAQSLINQGILEIEKVISNATAMGLKESVVVAPKLTYNIHHYSGIMFKIAYELKKKRKTLEALAAGGRYDIMIDNMRKIVNVTGNPELKQSAVGVSITVDKLVAALLECEDFQLPPVFDVLVCSLGNNSLLKEKTAIARELWNAGISSQIQNECMNTVEEIQDLCKEYRAFCSVILKDTEIGSVRMRWLDKDRYSEKKVQMSELVDFLLQKRLPNKNEIQESVTQTTAKLESNRLERSTSESIMTSSITQHNIFFVKNEKQLTPHVKKKYEAQIMSHLLQVLQNFSPKLYIEIIAVDLSSDVLNSIVTHLDMDGDENSFQASLAKVVESHPRYKKYLHKLFDKICQLKFEKKQPVLILYGLPEYSYKVIM